MLKATGDVETGIRGLIRGALAAASHVPHLARIAERVQDMLHPPPAPQPAAEAVAPPPQRELWVIDGDGLPPRPWRIAPDARIECQRLGGCTILAAQCVARQVASQIQQTQQKSRGKASDYPLCTTESCAQGRGVRAALDPAANVEPDEDAGKGGYHRVRLRTPSERRKQRAAARKQDRIGLLDEVHILDVHADPEPEVEEQAEAVPRQEEGPEPSEGTA